MKKEYAEFLVRIPRTLEQAVRADAQKERRSRNAQIEVVLERYYGDQIAAYNGDIEQREMEVTA